MNTKEKIGLMGFIFMNTILILIELSEIPKLKYWIAGGGMTILFFICAFTFLNKSIKKLLEELR